MPAREAPVSLGPSVEDGARRMYLYFLLGFFVDVPNGATSNSSTLVVQGLGFDTLDTTLPQIPFDTYIALAIAAAIYVSHITHERSNPTNLIAGVTVLAVVGFAMMASPK